MFSHELVGPFRKGAGHHVQKIHVHHFTTFSSPKQNPFPPSSPSLRTATKLLRVTAVVYEHHHKKLHEAMRGTEHQDNDNSHLVRECEGESVGPPG